MDVEAELDDVAVDGRPNQSGGRMVTWFKLAKSATQVPS